MSLKKLEKITDKQIAEKGVQSLADRPNLTAQYGASGLSATQLKLWFDQLATFLAEKINEIQETISGDTAAQYIRVCLDEYGVDNLSALIEAFTDGSFADKILKVLPSAGSDVKKTLQALINDHAKALADLAESKLTKITATNTYKRAYIIMPDGTQAVVLLAEEPVGGAIPLYTDGGNINVAIPLNAAHAANKGYTDAQDKLLGANVELSIDTNTYVMTLKLKNTAGTVLSTANVDFPIESVVVGGEYSGGVLTLRLKSGEVLHIDISAIVDGLINTSTFNEGVATLNGRIDETNDSLQAFIDRVEVEKVYAHSAFTAEEAETSKHYTKGGKIDKRFREFDAKSGFSLSLSLDTTNYQLTVNMKNRKGEVISSGMVDLPIESLITNASYADKVLTLTLQSGNTLKINIADIVSGLVPETRKVNGKPLSADIVLTATDVGAYPKEQTYSKTETDNAIGVAKNALEQSVQEAKEEGMYSYYAEQAEQARGYTKGGKIDKALRKIDAKHITELDAVLDESNYQLTISLKNKQGEVISSAMVDLPLESFSTGGGTDGGGTVEETPVIYLAMEAETARGYIKGGAIDRALKAISKRVATLENK